MGAYEDGVGTSDGAAVSVVCPVCLGDRVLDCRDMDAALTEQFSDEEMAAYGIVKVGIIECPECLGFGTVTETRAYELDLLARLQVQKALERWEAMGRV